MHGEEKGVAPLKNAKKSSYPWAKIIPCVWQYIVVMKYRCDKALYYLECKIESLGPYPYLIFVRFLTFPPRRQAAGQGRRNVKKIGGAKLTYVVYLLNQLPCLKQERINPKLVVPNPPRTQTFRWPCSRSHEGYTYFSYDR